MLVFIFLWNDAERTWGREGDTAGHKGVEGIMGFNKDIKKSRIEEHRENNARFLNPSSMTTNSIVSSSTMF